MMDTIVSQLKELQGVQSENLTDQYMLGLYNGLELAVAIIEDRAPKYEHVARPKYSVRRNLYEVHHPDEVSLLRFCLLMRDKLEQARRRGRGGWETADPEYLAQLLREHVAKGDPVDVANFCMMLAIRGLRIPPEDDGK